MTDFRPLYVRIQDQLVARVASGEWAPGAMIPSEMALAQEIGASQGTVRKAIDQLCSDGVVTRVQGRGTFVAEQTPERANFRFFRMQDAEGAQIVPDLLRQIAACHPASKEQAASLEINPGDPVHVIDRVRTVEGEKAILETIAVPDRLMPGLSDMAKLPNALYPHYQSTFGITVLTTNEAISAVSATARQARMLSVPHSTALLRIERNARDLTGQIVEFRISHFLTRAISYAVTLR
ncbi:MAG: GntR family transcriptional regulator [Pseudomonadota bacterium]